MFINNLKVSLRVFGRNKAYTFINILGLSSGLAITMLIVLYVRFELSYEHENPMSDRLLRLTMDYLNGDVVIDQDAETYNPAGPQIQSEFSQVENFARASPINDPTLKVGENVFREDKLFAVDRSFIKLFNCKVVSGDPMNLLRSPDEVVLSQSIASEYFGKADVLGESLWISAFNKYFKVTGVVADSPENTHLKFNMLVSYATLGDENNKWDNNNAYTYILLSDPGQYESFNASLSTFNDRLHAENKILNERIIAQPVSDIHLYSNKSYELEQNGDAISVYFLAGVALLVIVIAIVNYINLSTAKSLDRAKEVGIRKVIGSSLTQLRLQFFTESFLINFISGLLALTLIIIFAPAFRNLAGLPTDFHFLNDSAFWYLLISAVVLTTILSSVFPALILSAFQPIKVLKGKFSRSSSGSLMRKGLVVFQFSITIFLLIQTLTAERQLSYMRSKDLGLDAEHTIVIRSATGKTGENYQSFKDRLLTHTQFESVALSNCVPGQPLSMLGSTNVGVNLVDAVKKESFNFYIYFADADFIPTMRMELIAGENFIAENRTSDHVVVNEEAIKLWGISEPGAAVGKKIDLWGSQRTIVGVIKNFHQASAKMAYLPMILMHTEGNNRLASVRVKAGDIKESLALVKSIYGSVFADSPFEYFFLDQEFDKQYRSEEQFEQVFGLLTLFAIVISCLGLFGLVSFTVANRTKEIGVRKVLGASVAQVLVVVSKEFLMLIFIAIVISISGTYFLIQAWLSRYAFRIDLSIWLFIAPASAVLVVSFFTIFIRTFKVSSANPVSSLRDE